VINISSVTLSRMATELKRYQQSRSLHFLTFSCYRRQPFLSTAPAREAFEIELERVRHWYGMFVSGYVVMPEHVHLLVSEPERKTLAIAIQMLKQIVSRKLRPAPERRFWQVRYYDLPVWSERKRIEKLRYIHRNPVTRGLVARPEDWEWSSFLAWSQGHRGRVEVESQWTARERERMGLNITVVKREAAAAPTLPLPKQER
jgi:putative transposase